MPHKAKHDLALLFLISLVTVCFAYSSPATLASLSFSHHTQGLCACCSLFEEHSSLKSLHDLLPYIIPGSTQRCQLKRHPPRPSYENCSTASLYLSSDPASSSFRALTCWIVLHLFVYCFFSSTGMWAPGEQMYCCVYCYMVRNIHHVNDLVECCSEERDSAEDGSHVSGLESRVTGSAVHWDREVGGGRILERSGVWNWTGWI